MSPFIWIIRLDRVTALTSMPSRHCNFSEMKSAGLV